jgi:hypothetical protein
MSVVNFRLAHWSRQLRSSLHIGLDRESYETYMKLFLLIVSGLIGLANAQAQTIPQQLWGKWVVTREIPTTTISCWGSAEAKTLLATEIEYSKEKFRWKNVVTEHPVAESKIVNAEQFHDDNSGQGSNSSQVTFRQLGIKAKQATQVSIRHSPAAITGATSEIPGDEVLLKNENTIIFSVCNAYFEAKRVATPPGS